jgi:hypothetical protein
MTPLVTGRAGLVGSRLLGHNPLGLRFQIASIQNIQPAGSVFSRA